MFQMNITVGFSLWFWFLRQYYLDQVTFLPSIFSFFLPSQLFCLWFWIHSYLSWWKVGFLPCIYPLVPCIPFLHLMVMNAGQWPLLPLTRFSFPYVILFLFKICQIKCILAKLEMSQWVKSNVLNLITFKKVNWQLLDCNDRILHHSYLN